MALYSYKSQSSSKCAKNISDTLNCTQLLLGIQLVKHDSTIVNSAVVSRAFHSSTTVALFAILLYINN